MYVSEECYAVLRTVQSGHVVSGACLHFVSHDAFSQRVEINTYIWERMTMKKKDVKSLATARMHANPGGLLEDFPNLGEFLTCAVFDDGARRESPSVTVWASGGQWKCAIKDRAESLVMWLSAEGLKELFQMMDLFVLEEDAPWRQDEYANPDKGKRLKR